MISWCPTCDTLPNIGELLEVTCDERITVIRWQCPNCAATHTARIPTATTARIFGEL